MEESLRALNQRTTAEIAVVTVPDMDGYAGPEEYAASIRALLGDAGIDALMVFYVLAMQCASTVAVVRRETNSWKWPVFQWVYMGALAWALAFATYQGGLLLGFH